MSKRVDTLSDAEQIQIESQQARERRWLEAEKERHKCYGCVWVKWPDVRHPFCPFNTCKRGVM